MGRRKEIGRVRWLTEPEKQACRELWEEIFVEDSEEFLDYYDRWKYAGNECFGIYDGEQLVSMMQLNPYKMQVHGSTVSSRYIIAVATRKEYRHRGMMAKLLKESLVRMQAQRMPFVFLMPAAEAIYYPFGFRYFYESNAAADVRWAAGETNTCGLAEENREPAVRLADSSDVEALVFFSERIQSELFDCYTSRDRHYYEMLLAELSSEGGGLLLLTEDAPMTGRSVLEAGGTPEPDGTPAAASIKAGQILAAISYWGTDALEIREILCRPQDKQRVLQALFRWLEKELAGAETKKVSIMGASFELEKKKPVIMGRIMDVTSFLELFSAEESMEILLEISDGFLEGNDGLYRWSISPRGSRVERISLAEDQLLRAAQAGMETDQAVEEDGRDSGPSGSEVVRCSVSELFSWMMGVGEPEGLLRKVRGVQENLY